MIFLSFNVKPCSVYPTLPLVFSLLFVCGCVDCVLEDDETKVVFAFLVAEIQCIRGATRSGLNL